MENNKKAAVIDSDKLTRQVIIDNLDITSIITNFEGTHKEMAEFAIQNLRDSGLNDKTLELLISNKYLAIDEQGYYIYYPELTKDERSLYYNKRVKDISKGSKYIKPAGMTSRLFRPPILPFEAFLDKNIPIIITEGEKKAIKATQEGFPCIALSGVNCWKKTPSLKDLERKSKEELLNWIEEKNEISLSNEDEVVDIIPDILNTDWKEREIFLCYDSDLFYKEPVRNALYHLAAYFIGEHNARVKIVILPNTEAKGLDDYLILFGNKAFQSLLDSARELTLKEIQDVLSGNENKALHFPIEIFKPGLVTVFDDLSKRMDAPIEYIASSALVGASTLMDGICKIDVLGDDSWVDSPILWDAIVGSPSAKKSPCLKITIDLINKFDEELYKKYKNQMKKYNDEMLDYNIALSKYKKDKQRGLSCTQPIRPVQPRNKMISIQNTTVETLVTAMEDNEGRGIGILVDELASFLKSLGQYKGSKGNDEEYFLQAWRKSQYRYKRKTTGEDCLIYPSHNILGSIQPKVLIKELFKGEFETSNGMIERWLFTCTDYKETGNSELSTRGYDISPLEQTFRNIYSIKEPRIYKFSRTAQQAFIDYKKSITKLKNNNSIPELMKTYLQKQTDYVARFSLVLHCMKDVHNSEIQLETVQDAIKLSNYFIEGFKRVANIVYSVSSNPMVTRTIENFKIKGTTTITPSTLYKSNTSLYKTTRAAYTVLSILSNYGYGRLIKTSNKGYKFKFYS